MEARADRMNETTKGRLLFKVPEWQRGYNRIVGPHNSELRLLEFGRLLMTAGEVFAAESGCGEQCLVIFGGRCTVEVGGPGRPQVRFENVGARDDVFDGKPTMVYVPRRAGYRIVCESDRLDAGIVKSPARSDHEPLLSGPEDCDVITPGAANWRRTGYVSLKGAMDVDRLIVGETFNPPGNWSSYPPHKHDASDPPAEAPYEEIYYFRVKPPQGFGIQRVYTPDGSEAPLDEVYVVEDGDTVALPRGYHPVAAAPGYRLYYLWALAGEGRKFGAWSDDPRHAWVRSLEGRG